MPGDFFFLNYGVQDGNVMQGLFRVEKSTLELQVYNGSQWIPVAGSGGGDTSAKAMSTAKRMAFVPESGTLIWDTDLERLFIGNGYTAGGVDGSSYTAGDGLNLTDQTFSLTTAEVQEVLNGTQTIKAVDVSTLRGALTTGQAVDVTSIPDQTITGDYKGTFTTTSTTLGFASFPKYAAGLKYLMIADVTVTAARNITPSGTWLDGSTAAKALAANTVTRVAMLFNAANKCKFTFSGSGTVTVSNLREYEVTACAAESIAYIASLSNPDAFADYYLVKADMVQPWTYIIDMGTSSAVTIAAGLSYKLNALTGTHTLTVDTCPTGYDGRDAIIRIRLGGNGVVQTVAPLQLGNALVPYAINNCVVKFRDGEAVLLVEDTLAGYVVTVNSGTDSGSLAYGLASTGIPYIAFSTGTDGTPVQLENAVTANEEVNAVGNGYTNTTVTGNITCTNKTVFANISLQDVNVTGGTLTLGDVFIPSGSTVSVSGGGLAVEKVTGAGSESVIDFNGGGLDIKNPFVISGVTLTDADAGVTSQGVNNAFVASSSGVFSDCTISGNHTGFGVVRVGANDGVLLSNCEIVDNLVTRKSPGGAVLINTGAVATIADSVIKDNHQQSAVGSNLDVCVYGTASLTGSNAIGYLYGNGSVTITSGAILDLTGNMDETPITPYGGITFASGGATVLVNGGTEATSSSYMIDNMTLPAGAKLTNTAVVNIGGTEKVVIPSGSTASASGVEFTSGNGNLRVESGATVELTSCNITSGTSQYGAGIYVSSSTAKLSGCTVSANSGGNPLYCFSGKYVLDDCNVNNAISMRGTGNVEITGVNNTILKIKSFSENPQTSATVTISSGASIALTESINFGGNITVLEGGCTVNGNTIPAGTYTSINSNGQPT